MQITKSYFSGNQIRLNIRSEDKSEIESWVNFFYNIGAYNVPMAEQKIETPVTEINMPRERLTHCLHSYYEGKLMAERCEKKGLKYSPCSSNLPTNVKKQVDRIVHDFLNNMPEEVYGYRQSIGMIENGSMPSNDLPKNFSCYCSVPVED